MQIIWRIQRKLSQVIKIEYFIRIYIKNSIILLMLSFGRSFQYVLCFMLVIYSCTASLTVTPLVATINSVTSYEWNITGLTAAPSNTTIIMQFPANCIFNSPVVLASDGLPYNGGANVTTSGTNITVRLMTTHQSNTSFYFKVTNVQNPSSQVTDLAIFYQGSSSTSFAVGYSKGPITNCLLNFLGVTDQATSTAFLDLQTTNPISKNKTVFIIQYGTYTQFRSSLVSNGNINCSYSLDGGNTYSTQVLSKIVSSTYLNCEFPNLNLVSNENIKLKLTGVRNPPFKNNYMPSPLKVQTSDGSRSYDAASSCTLGDVSVDTYLSQFTQTSKTVNTNYSNPNVQTIQQITKNFKENDSILIQHNGITFGAVGSFILFTRITTTNSIRFDLQSGNGTTNILTQNNLAVSNSQTDRIRLTLSNFILTVPPSAALTNLTFRFFRAATSPLPLNATLEYLNIYATLQPKAATFPASGSLSVIPSTSVIGDPTNYRFSLKINNALSDSAKILLYLPLGLNISQNSNSYPTCILQSSAVSPITQCSVYDLPNNIIQVNINSSAGLTAQTLNITIGNLTNPINPDKSYSFGAKTYYNQSDMTSQTQVGYDLTIIYYTFRSMVVNTSGTVYTVSQNPAALVLYYFPAVLIPANLIMTFNFTTNLVNIKYKNITINGVSSTLIATNTTTQLFSLTINNDITANSNVTITFQFQAPNNQSNYPALDISVGSSTKIYEKTTTTIYINVGIPASQIFTFTPSIDLTGVKTSYSLKFFTNVPHPKAFNLSIKFPSDVTIDTAMAKCSPVTACTAQVFDKSVGGIQQIYVNITASNLSSIYTIFINNITNSRQIGSSGIFTFTTLTSTGNRILAGSSTVSITSPNVISPASFDKSKSYYRSNIEPVTMTGTSYNQLKTGDYLRVFFDYRTYVLASTGSSGIKCSDGNNCTYDATLSTTYSIVVLIQLLNLTSPYKFSIQGLNSSSTTYSSQQFEVLIKSYSSSDRQIDQGKLTYNLSCISNALLISKTCQKCNQGSNVCTTCYTGYYLYNKDSCVTNCASSSTYQTYPGSTQCVSCINNCKTCIDSQTCLTCLDRSFFLYQDSTCRVGCNTTGGFYGYYPTNSQQMCLACWSTGCMKCSDGGSSSCLDCGTNFLQNGKCITNCNALTSYISTSGQCLPCYISCEGCTGSTNSQCIKCRSGFFNVSGICDNSCPAGTVPLTTGTCGCQGNCQTCQLYSTRCTACSDISSKLYNYQCLANCPDSTFYSGGKCIDCSQGCQSCTAQACVKCLAGYNVYETKCFTQCNNVGERYAAVNGVCIECPVGCDNCDGNLTCSVCLANYTLVNQQVCQRTCQIQGNCQKVNPVPDKIIPIPGSITAGVWLIILVCLKFFFINKMYLPYSYVFFSCVVQFILIIAVLAKTDTYIKSLIAQNSVRLLVSTITTQQAVPQVHQYTVLGLLGSSLILNYIQNFVFLFLFCKYLKKYIPDRQIDKISNYLVLAVGILTNFRFCLMAYSKMFPKPSIVVENQSKLTPIHYMCIASIFTSILPVVAAGLLIYNQYALTDLFMLGIDLLIIVILSLMFTIWMVSVDKPIQYFESTKKYSKEEINQTQEGIANEKDDMKINNSSHFKLRESSSHIDNSIIHVEDIKEQIQNPILERSQRNQTKISKLNKSDNQNEPLPHIPVRTTQINLQAMKIKRRQNAQQGRNAYQSQDDQSLQQQERKRNLKNSGNFSEQKTQRNNKNKSDLKNTKYGKKDLQEESGNKKIKQGYHHPQVEQRGIKNRSKESPKNFGKERSLLRKQKPDQMSLKIQNVSKATNKGVQFNESEQLDDQLAISQPSLKPAQSDVVQRQKKVLKPITQRSSGIIPVTMKKKDSYGLFQSQQAVSQVDEVDLESIIQTKMIDKTKQQNKKFSKDSQIQHEQISPSWFNQQNQRFDFEQNSDV